MQTQDENFCDDERDMVAQQQADRAEQEWRLTDILRKCAEKVPLSTEEVVQLCIGCGIDKRSVF